MAITWITPAGALVPTVTERVTLDIPIQATSNIGPVTFSLIAGSLPRGLRVDSNITQVNEITTGYIKGSPAEVRKYTLSRFVIRADDGVDVEDRTFSIGVDGADNPQWVTKEGFLNVGSGKNYFVLDNAYVNFQLEAYDPDTLAGETLEYFLMPNGGELPPGLSLSSDGIISGFTDPVFALEYTTLDNGAYDTGSFDAAPLDFGKNATLGYDSYNYDDFNFDFSETPIVPRRLSRVYTFAVGVTDGIAIETRIFKIYVVTEEFLKADNTLIEVDTNLFTADNTSNRTPIWITESDLGRVRANNYITIFLDVYDPPTLTGSIAYFLLDTNPDGTPSLIPPGLILDSTTGELAGRVPYQDRVSKRYSWTMRAVDFPTTLGNFEYNLTGDWNSQTVYNKNEAVRFNGVIYLCLAQNKNKVPSETPDYWMSGVSTADKTFTIEVIGEIESGITWISDSDLGSLDPNKASTISIQAESRLYGGRVVYEVVNGTLPPGLSMLPNGLIIGKVRQIQDGANLGLTRFYDPVLTISGAEGTFNDGDIITGSESKATAKIIRFDYNNNELYYKLLSGNFIDDINGDEGEKITSNSGSAYISQITKKYTTTFDQENTTFDRVYRFVVEARDTANASADTKTFFIKITTENSLTFANLWVKSLQEQSKRVGWFDFISNIEIFEPANLYRYGDLNFGVQSEVKMLVYAGIESVEAVKFVQAMSRNHYKKRLLFGDVKMAKAKDPKTQETIYEVVYVEIIDEYEKNGKSISPVIELKDDIKSKVLVSYDAMTVDSDIPFASDSDHQRIFPNSIKNMRDRIASVGQRERTFLPLWMRSIQDQAEYELGYTKALVLCYANPGKSAEIISKIKASGFDFKMIDFVVDRYIIDMIDGKMQDKYLVFPQPGEKRP